GFDLTNPLFQCQQRNIKGSSSEIEDNDVMLLYRLEAFIPHVGENGSSRFVHGPKDVKASNAPSVCCGSSLRSSEVSWNGNDGICDNLANVLLCCTLQL